MAEGVMAVVAGGAVVEDVEEAVMGDSEEVAKGG